MADSVDYIITATWKNTGRIPTALEMAQRVKIVQEDQAILDFDKKLLEGDSVRLRIIDPKTLDKTRYCGHLAQNKTASATFTVRVKKGEPVKGKVKVLSTRGGVLEREVVLE